MNDSRGAHGRRSTCNQQRASDCELRARLSSTEPQAAGFPLWSPRRTQAGISWPMKQWRQGAGHTSSPIYPEPCQLSPARTSRSRDEEPDWGLSHSPGECPQGRTDWAPSAGVFLQHPGQPPPTLPQGLGPWPRGTAALRPGCQSRLAVHTMALKVF